MNKKFDISDVIEYIAGVLEPDASTAFEQALTEDSILKSQYDEMLVYSENIKHNFDFSAKVDYNLVDFINDSDSPRIGDIYSLLNVDVSGVIIDSDENFYRIMPLSTYTSFAEQHDIVFTGKGFKKGNGVAHTHLAVALDKSELGVKRGKLDNDLLKALQHADSGNPVELPAGVTFGEGVDELLLDNYDEWVEDLRDELYALSEKGLQAAEEKEDIEEKTPREALIIRLDNILRKPIEEARNQTGVYVSAADSTSLIALRALGGQNIFEDDFLTVRFETGNTDSITLLINFTEPIKSVETVTLSLAGKTVIEGNDIECTDNSISVEVKPELLVFPMEIFLAIKHQDHSLSKNIRLEHSDE